MTLHMPNGNQFMAYCAAESVTWLELLLSLCLSALVIGAIATLFYQTLCQPLARLDLCNIYLAPCPRGGMNFFTDSHSAIMPAAIYLVRIWKCHGTSEVKVGKGGKCWSRQELCLWAGCG